MLLSKIFLRLRYTHTTSRLHHHMCAWLNVNITLYAVTPIIPLIWSQVIMQSAIFPALPTCNGLQNFTVGVNSRLQTVREYDAWFISETTFLQLSMHRSSQSSRNTQTLTCSISSHLPNCATFFVAYLAYCLWHAEVVVFIITIIITPGTSFPGS